MYERQSEREKRVMKEQEWKRAVHGGSLVLTTSCACFLIMMVSNTRYPLYQVDMPSVDRYIQQLHKQNETIDKDAASDDGTSDRHDRDPNLTISTQTQPSSNAFVKFPKSLTCSFAGQSHEIPMVPNFLIVGVQKSGTTSLFKYLMQHPNVIPTKKFLETTLPKQSRVQRLTFSIGSFHLRHWNGRGLGAEKASKIMTSHCVF
jgi:hypothetical protein